MSPRLYQKTPLSVLVLTSDADTLGNGILSALRAHYTLFCHSTRQALNSAASFSPAVVILDPNLPNSSDFVSRLSQLPGLAQTTFIALALPEMALTLPAGYHHLVTAPVAAQEFEQILNQVEMEHEVDRPIFRTA